MRSMTRIATRNGSGPVAIVAILLVAAGCSSNDDSTTAVAEPSAASTTAPAADTTSSTLPDPLAVPTVEGTFAVDADGRQLAIMCWGEGSPAVLFDAGSGDAGINRWRSSSITR